MQFTLDSSSSRNLIRGYSAEGIRIGDRLIGSSCIVSAEVLLDDWAPQSLAQLEIQHLERIFELQPELVLLGTGMQHRFPSAQIRAAFIQRGVALEPMELGAACRTFNVLVQEERRVAAALFLR